MIVRILIVAIPVVLLIALALILTAPWWSLRLAKLIKKIKTSLTKAGKNLRG